MHIMSFHMQVSGGRTITVIGSDAVLGFQSQWTLHLDPR